MADPRSVVRERLAARRLSCAALSRLIGLTEAVGQALWASRSGEGDIAWADAGWWREKYAMLAGAAFASLEGRAF